MYVVKQGTALNFFGDTEQPELLENLSETHSPKQY